MRIFTILFATVAMFGHKDAYIIKTDDNTSISGASVDQIVAVHKRLPAQSIWVRRGGREYVIVDDKTHRQVLALFEPQMALEPEQEAVGREEAQLDREADRLEDKDEALTAAEKRRLSELRARLKEVSRRERDLDEKEEALEREAERQFWPLIDSAIRSGMAKPLTR